MARRGHGEGSISQRTDGRWVPRLELFPGNGKRDRKYIYCLSQNRHGPCSVVEQEGHNGDPL
jgi:hypothetical protein